MATIKNLSSEVTDLETWYQSDGAHIAYMIWQKEDVVQAANELEMKLSDEQIDEVIDYVHSHADAENGISWTSIKETILAIKGREVEA